MPVDFRSIEESERRALPSETALPTDRTVPLPPAGPTLYRRELITVPVRPLILTDGDGEWLYEMLLDASLADDEQVRCKLGELTDCCIARRQAQRGRQRIRVVR